MTTKTRKLKRIRKVLEYYPNLLDSVIREELIMIIKALVNLM